MKDLYIVGAGGCGREVLQILKDINRIQGPRWNIVGFLDDTEEPLAGRECDYGVVGTIKDYVPCEKDVLVMAIASPQAKQTLAPMLLEKGAHFETIIPPGVSVGDFTSIGMGVVMYPKVAVSVNVQIGDFVTLLSGVGHDVKVGGYSTISGSCEIMGGVQIEENVFVGGGCVVIPKIIIEKDAYVGAGSVVIRKVRAGTHVFGNPAKSL